MHRDGMSLMLEFEPPCRRASGLQYKWIIINCSPGLSTHKPNTFCGPFQHSGCAFQAFPVLFCRLRPPFLLLLRPPKKELKSSSSGGDLEAPPPPPWPLRAPPHNYSVLDQQSLRRSARAMNDHGGEDQQFCDFHPTEAVIGVCAHCLKERLLVLASKRRHRTPPPPPLPKKSSRSFRVARRRRIIKLPKVFALGPFLYRLESRRRGEEDEIDDSDEEESIASNEDSFISVKFDDEGQASWDNKEGTSTGPSIDSKDGGNEVDGSNQIMVEKTKKSKGLKWKKRIGQLLHLKRSKRSNDKGTLQVGAFGGGKGRKNWVIGRLTRRRRHPSV